METPSGARLPETPGAAHPTLFLPYAERKVIKVAAPADQVFGFVDDPKHLAGHMSARSWSMGGGRMDLDLDSTGGRAVGSRMHLHGSAFGLRLDVLTEVSEREPPVYKAWQTVGTPRLLVIGEYRMRVDIESTPDGSRARISIHYALPGTRAGVASRWLARAYARWCVDRMATDIDQAFAVARQSDT